MIEPVVRKSKPKTILLLAVFFVILAISGWQFLTSQLQSMETADHTIIELRIPDNSSARQVAALLKQNGLIRSERVFLSYCSQRGLDTQLKAGLYELSRSQTLPELAMQIAQGKIKGFDLTIPEGYTVKQIGQQLVKEQMCTEEQWLDIVQIDYDYDFLTAELEGEKRLEGFLFPDTYIIDEDTGAQDIVRMMLDNFSRIWQENFAQMAAAKQMDVHDVIVIASLIEREAQVAGDRKIIAGVIYNRLEKGMPLQIDATVLYSKGEHREVVTYKDLEIDSPYNTYRHVGLPPGPIASPGIDAIDAAINPEINDYYYYVARGDGSHVFSTTYAEHLLAKKNAGL